MAANLPDDAPDGLLWVPELLEPAEAEAHLAGLMEEIPWEDHTFTIFGRTLPMPRPQ